MFPRTRLSLQIAVFFLLFILLPEICRTRGNHRHHYPYCPPSSCGKIHNISHPFRLKGDPPNCGDSRYELWCDQEQNRTVVQLYSGQYNVEDINYTDYSMRLVDPGVQKDNSCSLPSHSLGDGNFSYGDPYVLETDGRNKAITFLDCAAAVTYVQYYVDITLCGRGNTAENAHSITSSSSPGDSCPNHSYAIFGRKTMSDVVDSCSIRMVAWVQNPPTAGDLISDHNHQQNISFAAIHDKLAYGFWISWYNFRCGRKCFATGGYCLRDNNTITCKWCYVYPKITSSRPFKCA
ncbi:LEAF RUST 10 DISEASE-RESISTANCE LOCUS RECEPTOR-LIKE PROTEIN KINASE-like 1.2 [Malania oleifera]|uniref:LEAF RUST 10 DISEASE-RESISTANCE LOCUS RECEPTOR-LIKE PROTEIN KINASE-like 1.2 n=1 Tax=Malania oleifera TaxID=397392 RepID=UPI0025AEB2CB|nr:LEAF RUST 10 DISEASE-RESISTANCE LOCUS RECEPTOR-LIKE PROTEIN KINASE-like 1.2 [Malania oleifera]